MKNWATQYEMLITEVLDGLLCLVPRSWESEDGLSDNFYIQEGRGTMGKKVLVVDDEGQIRDLLKEFLFDEACKVSLASNGKEAIELTEKEQPDVI